MHKNMLILITVAHAYPKNRFYWHNCRQNFNAFDTRFCSQSIVLTFATYHTRNGVTYFLWESHSSSLIGRWCLGIIERDKTRLIENSKKHVPCPSCAFQTEVEKLFIFSSDWFLFLDVPLFLGGAKSKAPDRVKCPCPPRWNSQLLDHERDLAFPDRRVRGGCRTQRQIHIQNCTNVEPRSDHWRNIFCQFFPAIQPRGLPTDVKKQWDWNSVSALCQPQMASSSATPVAPWLEETWTASTNQW